MHDIRGACCLDVFAGSGAIGFEAFSRGAHQVYFLEQNQVIFKNLKRIAQEFNSSNLILKCVNALQFLQDTDLQFDIIFLDPPFQSELAGMAIEIIENRSILKVGGFLYLEAANEIKVQQTIWELLKHKKAGQVLYSLLQKKS